MAYWLLQCCFPYVLTAIGGLFSSIKKITFNRQSAAYEAKADECW